MKANEHIVSQDGKTKDRRYMLDGLVLCAECQMIMDMDNPVARMQSVTKKGRSGNTYSYYHCKHTPVSHSHARADHIEQQLIDFLLSGSLAEDFDGKELTLATIAQDHDIAQTQQRIDDIADMLKRMDFRFDNGAITDPHEYLWINGKEFALFKTDTMYRVPTKCGVFCLGSPLAQRQKLENEAALLKFRKADGYEYALSVVNNFPSHWNTAEGDFDKQRELIRTIVHQVIVSDKKLVAIIIKPSHHIIFAH